eukprot:UN00610
MWSVMSIALILLISSLNARRSRLLLSEEEVDCLNSCVNDCSGVADGNYRECGNSHGFVQCSNDILSTQDCNPLTLLFNPVINACDYTSGCCPACVDDCSGKANGNYRKCHDCHGFVQCSNGHLYNQACHPLTLFFDDALNRCEYKSPCDCE